MIWKVIGQSVIGKSHIESGKSCEDALNFKIFSLADSKEGLACFVSDGAGSALYAEEAAKQTVLKALEFTEQIISRGIKPEEKELFEIAEHVYEHINNLAVERKVPKNEFSCTLLGFIIMPDFGCFIQIGDGAIVKSEYDGFLTPVWWPQNGEYQNSTTFLIDDPSFPNLRIKVIEEEIFEIGIFTDGIQMLTLNYETKSVHQPFFKSLFPWLRKAKSGDDLKILNNRLNEYLSGNAINVKTDDDKTLLLATRLQ